MEQPLIHFNRGVVSELSLARVDQKRVAISAETQTNFIPRVLGPMSLRPGLEYITNTNGNNQAKYLEFIFAKNDTALIELTNGIMRVLIDETPLTRPAVTAATTNGSFTSNITGWTDNSDANGVAAWATGGYLSLNGNASDFGIVDQQVTVNQTGTEHALRIDVTRGPVICMVGSTTGDDDYVTETSLNPGLHSLAFTPTGNFHIQFKNSTKRVAYVNSCTVESSGIVTMVVPWTANDLQNIRFDQSGDVLFVACDDFQQRRIERRDTRSWSIVTYQPEDGPFMIENITPITMTPTALSGNTTLTASAKYFKSTNIGGLFRLESQGQTQTRDNLGDNEFTDAIKVTGITSDRIFTIVIEELVDSTVTLQRSLESETGPWSDIPSQFWTTNITKTYDDGLDNQIVWYQLGIKTGDYGTDASDVQLIINTGSVTGVCRVTGYTSDTVVDVEVIEDFGNITATKFWSEGSWSDRRGWPSSVAFYEGRLWWSGKDRTIGSISDAFDKFDPDFEGDAGPINRTIGSGPVDTINWILPLQRLVLGAQMAEFSVRSNSFDEPLTPTNFNIKSGSTQGSAAVSPAKLDSDGIFIQGSGERVYRLTMGGDYDYTSEDLTLLVPEMGSPGIVDVGVQRKYDTRIHCVRSDGTVMLGVYDKAEEVLAWIDIETDGQIEDVAIFPGDPEDTVYYAVRRTINGSTVRYLEKVALETDCRGGTTNKQADAMYVYSGAAITTVTGLSHLERENVVVWADGADVGTDSDYSQTYTVVSGQITLAAAASNIVVGLPYTGQFKSAKLAAQSDGVVSLVKHKRIDWLSLLLKWVHPKGLRFGPDFVVMDDMPEVEEGAVIDTDTVRETYTEHEIMFPGDWAIDSRVCLQAQAPRPCTVLGAVPELDIGG